MPDDQSLPTENPAAAAPVAPTEPGPSAQLRPVPASADDALPKVMSVMCPTGFTATSTEGLTLDKPLFARVTYRTR